MNGEKGDGSPGGEKEPRKTISVDLRKRREALKRQYDRLEAIAAAKAKKEEEAQESRRLASKQQLRIALMMNGGVSLAVWMGGVTRELDRVRREDGVYGELLELTESEARIDVIAGASAGGINGAVLALAIARGTRVDGVRDLWLEDGDIAALLRDPGEADVPSVLLGDGQLLDKLHDALTELGSHGTTAPVDHPPLHLSITGTIPQGQVTNYPDAFGAEIPDANHRALFRFRRPGMLDGARSPLDWPDDFARGAEGTEDVPAARLALAARSSASFPIAFEPSFVPIGAARDRLHPDMKGAADFDSSRWVIDGGVLVNTPIEQTLDAIKELPAEGPVRRVLGYVVPDPVEPVEAAAASMPTPLDVAKDALSRLPRVQSVGRQLSEIVVNNEEVHRRRDARRRLLGAVDPDTLLGLAVSLIGAYVEVRRAAAAEEVAQLITEATGSSPTPTAEQRGALTSALGNFPQAPWAPPTASEARASFEGELDRPWRWGIAPLENALNLMLQVVRDTPRLLERTGDDGAEDLFEELGSTRRELHEALDDLRGVQKRHRELWTEAALVFLDPDSSLRDGGVEGTVESLAREWQERLQGSLDLLATRVARLVVRHRSLLTSRLPSDAGDDIGGEQAGFARMLAALGTGEDGDEAQALRSLLALDVIQRSSGADLAGVEQAVELVLMSANANTFGRATKAGEKLTGLQVHHFGAFYKASWRAGDWLWGRLDGADRLILTLLDPVRLRRRLLATESPERLSVDQALQEIRRIACREDGSEQASWLAEQWRRSGREHAVRNELTALRDSLQEPLPTALPGSYDAICTRVQLEVVCEELPKVAEAVKQDRKAGADANSEGYRWQQRFYPEAGTKLDVEQTLRAFCECGVWKEKVEGELGSPRFFKVATKGAEVIVAMSAWTVARVRHLKFLKTPLAILRRLLGPLTRLGRAMPPGG